ncbi:MAG: D-alanine--D-alanine ligase [Bacteroidetes bacterium]|nr:D-alanine--D-alanine ligase [Rhodothermia bacterium]MCS7154761.1 D-alanine--D-alanine ligase [Bacteroidota bacterium]MCX7907082.1 D-alanine--D-alanine ligase [Bacteroidota bacterium]MDW8137554.1 D-alanine--D-alanine ligase [Bacteroidota bacterium]MDW8285492.1 D-alanine--D-alanine ligase [Bacteroidota bacterium]
MRIGLIYELFEHFPWDPDDPPDADAEWEPEETVRALEEALRLLGHDPIRLGGPEALLRRGRPDVEAALSIAEGRKGRFREARALALLELWGIPYLGSDPLTVALSLDKAWTKDLVAAAGVRTPPYRVYRPGQIPQPDELPGPFPLFVKPRYEGSSKGITVHSRVESFGALCEQVRWVTRTYQQDALVEVFIAGAEFTVAVVGPPEAPRAYPVLQRAVETQTGIGLHALEHRGMPRGAWSYRADWPITGELEQRLQEAALRAYQKLECRDFARADFRVDSEGRVWFLEINPLPTFSPEGTFGVLAEYLGRSYVDFLAELLQPALERLVRLKRP